MKTPVTSVLVLHPPLLAIYRVLLLYANNMEKTPLSAVVRPALVLAMAAVGLWLILWLILRNRYKAGFVASVLIVASLTGWHILEYIIGAYVPFLAGFPAEGYFFLYAALIGVGLLYIVRQNWNRPRRAARLMTAVLVGAVALVLLVSFVLGPVYGAAPAWSMMMYVVLVGALLVYVFQWKGQFTALTQTANWFAIILVAISVALIVVHRPEPPVPFAAAHEVEALPGLQQDPPADRPKPDIYFIVLEGYARADVLRNDFGYNNMPFFKDMEDRGFWIAQNSFANYSNTVPSIASSLNMDTLQDLVPELAASAGSADLQALLHHNRVYDFLKRQGYETLVFSPGAELLEPRDDVDKVLKPAGALCEFESVLLDTSLVARGFQLRDYWQHGSTFHSSEQIQRRRVLFTFDQLGQLPAQSAGRPRFVYAHLLVPEPPFLFARDGDWPKPLPGETRQETWTRYRMSLEKYRRAYADQLHCTNGMLLQAIDKILAGSPKPPAILVVSSRGPKLAMAGEEPPSAPVREQLANLIMARIPDDNTEPLMPPGNESLANLFRAVFSRVFGCDLPVKPPRAYVCTDEWPVEFEPVDVAPLVQ